MDAFELAHHGLLKLKKYEGLVYNDEHAIDEINQITGTLTNINVGNRSKNLDKDVQNKINKSSVETVGNVANLLQNNSVTANQDQTMVTTFKNTKNDLSNLQTVEPIRYPTAVSLTRLPVLTQQITEDLQLLQSTLNKLSSQLNEMAKLNTLLKKAVKST